MKKEVLKKALALILVTTMAAASLAGCSNKETSNAAAVEETKTEEAISAPYFTRGVYSSYNAADQNTDSGFYYVFYDENTGYYENSKDQTGAPFSCEQKDGKVYFTFGGEGEDEDILEVISVDNGTVKASYVESDSELIFVLDPDADPDNFNAQNADLAEGERAVYKHENGWTVKYNPSCIEVTGGGPTVGFVYTGECAGTCMITVSYNVDKDAKTAMDEMAEKCNVKVEERPFPVTGEENGYWVNLTEGQTGPGLYETAVAVDHMDGYILMDITTHIGGDDAMDIPVSDALEEIVDTFEFTAE